MSPVSGHDIPGGDVAYTEALVARPPAGVTYTTYVDALGRRDAGRSGPTPEARRHAGRRRPRLRGPGRRARPAQVRPDVPRAVPVPDRRTRCLRPGARPRVPRAPPRHRPGARDQFRLPAAGPLRGPLRLVAPARDGGDGGRTPPGARRGGRGPVAPSPAGGPGHGPVPPLPRRAGGGRSRPRRGRGPHPRDRRGGRSGPHGPADQGRLRLDHVRGEGRVGGARRLPEVVGRATGRAAGDRGERAPSHRHGAAGGVGRLGGPRSAGTGSSTSCCRPSTSSSTRRGATPGRRT